MKTPSELTDSELADEVNTIASRKDALLKEVSIRNWRGHESILSRARLITAADDLLLACQEAVEWAEDAPAPYRDWNFVKLAKAAITKATTP